MTGGDRVRGRYTTTYREVRRVGCGFRRCGMCAAWAVAIVETRDGNNNVVWRAERCMHHATATDGFHCWAKIRDEGGKPTGGYVCDRCGAEAEGFDRPASGCPAKAYVA